MSIVNTITEVYPQRDGERHIVERHTDHTGQEYMRLYFAPAEHDVEAAAAQHAAELEQRLAEIEIEGLLNG